MSQKLWDKNQVIFCRKNYLKKRKKLEPILEIDGIIQF